MENIICPLRIGLAPTHDIIDLDGSVNEDFMCLGIACAKIARCTGSEGSDAEKIAKIDMLLREIGVDNIGSSMTRGEVNYNCIRLYKKSDTVGEVLVDKF